MPAPLLDPFSDLPVSTLLPAITASLAVRHELVLEAPPGAGKTTLVPLALLAADWLAGRRIVVLQQRRMAARAAAERMAAMLGERAGETVGYRVRQETRVSRATRIEVVTEGVLTRMLLEDPALDGVGLLVFDEFHERHIDSDLGLALALNGRSLFRGADDPLRLLVMSATLDGLAVAAALDDAPVLRAEGRAWPLTVQHALATPAANAWLDALIATLHDLLQQPAAHTGSILVFLPGLQEIRRVAEALPARADVAVHALHGSLALADQHRAIAPLALPARKIVLATNIAETSLTIDGIRTVVDAGLAREPVHDPASGLTRLRTRRISRASSVQRAGRAARTAPGRCIRLWSEEEQQRLAPRNTPEILQADLTPLALTLLAWGCDTPAELRWLDAPPAGPWSQALELLREFGAATRRGERWQLTPLGERMATLPVHPRLARMLLGARTHAQQRTACALAGLLSERIPAITGGADIAALLAIVTGEQRCPHGHQAWLARVRRQAASYADCCAPAAADAPTESGVDAGVLLALAYPDRIARRRDGGRGQYLLANGRSAALAETDALGNSAWLVAADVGGRSGAATDRIHLAARLDERAFAGVLAPLVTVHEHVAWDDAQQRFLAERQQRLGELVLARERLANVPAARKRAVLCELIARRGHGLLPWTDELRQWQARVQLLHGLHAHEAGNPWPDVGDERLLATLDAWLGPHLDAVSTLAGIARLDLAAILQALLPWPQARELDRLAPPRLEVPSGSLVAIDYTQSPPVLAVKLQEMFGARSTPTVAGGRVALLVHLLSPARRPLQITQDLAGFWQNSYPDVRKDMRGRYPKHPWPEDPCNAPPTRHTKNATRRPP